VLVNEAVLLAREVFGEKHPKYADALIDLGRYLVNRDRTSKSMQAYEKALKVIIFF
jgi:cytochrome c-type biogenesis protein CcmH/NrfG